MKRSFVIDYLPECVSKYTSSYAIAAIDVIRATTMAATAGAMGHTCYAVGSVEEAFQLAATLVNPLLAGEIAGIVPEGFHMNNSPAELMERGEIDRPLVLLSSSGTRLLHNAASCANVYVACLRNYSAVADRMAEKHDRVALIGAGSRGQFREEDQLCCAWMGRRLLALGFEAADDTTEAIVAELGDADVRICALGESAAYLQRSGQLSDLEFVLEHVDDLPDAFMLQHRAVVRCRPTVSTELDPTFAAVAP